MMEAVAEPNFYSELLDRLTELRLSMVVQCADIYVWRRLGEISAASSLDRSDDANYSSHVG